MYGLSIYIKYKLICALRWFKDVEFLFLFSRIGDTSLYKIDIYFHDPTYLVGSKFFS